MSDTNNICSNEAYNTSILLKKRFQLFRIPPQRYDNLQNSPYIENNLNKKVTQDELNMRRKAEILKYSASKSNTKTNNFSKREKWAQLVNGSSQQRQLPYYFIQNNLIPGTNNYINTCPNGTIMYTPTSASDIPGPIMNLYNDSNVPLYMYSTNTNPYGLINQELTTQQFTYDICFNNIINETNSVIVTSIYIMNILTSTYMFNIQFPISIFIRANVISGQTGNYNNALTFDFSNNPFQTSVYYGTNPVINNGTINNPTFSLSSSIKSVSFDISINLNTHTYFVGNQYIGMYSINNLLLNTQQGYIYDIYSNNVDSNNIPSFKLTDTSQTFDTTFQEISYGICTNPSLLLLNQKNINCNIVNPSSFPSLSTYSPLSIV
jgi:hypothetical protein